MTQYLVADSDDKLITDSSGHLETSISIVHSNAPSGPWIELLASNYNPDTGIWTDISGNNLHAVQNTQANRPVLDSGVVKFNSVNTTSSLTIMDGENSTPHESVNGLTIAFRAKYNTLGQNQTFFCANDGSGVLVEGLHAYGGNTSGQQGWINAASAPNNIYVDYGGYGQIPNDTNWHTYVIVFHKTTIVFPNIYINGVNMGAWSSSSRTINPAAGLTIGNHSSGRPFYGSFDKFWAWKRELTAPEIATWASW
jgi:hypothetical protein